MKRTFFTILLAAIAAVPASAASVTRSYSYFSIDGNTLEEIEQQLLTRGPQINGTDARHPGAVRMEFASRLSYGEGRSSCRVTDARVTVKAKVILPRWRGRRNADSDVRLIWDTLSRDIRRHEESHLVIARNHAHELEDALKALSARRTCAEMEAGVKAATARILEKHDAAQARFDRIETMNFEDRIKRLLNYRMEQIEKGRLKP